jgi:catechol 2,3-dioxygenase-like lactoylglutathione lyase family enzyme
MKVKFLVLYVKDVEQSKEFWTQKVGMVVKNSIDTGEV